MNKGGVLAVVLGASLVAAPSYLLAYTGGDVKDGGSISGTVKFAGSAPAPKKLEVTKDKEVCAKGGEKVDKSLVVSNGNIEYAVVTITDIKTGKKIDAKKINLDQKDCEYHPHVVAFPVGTPLEINNPDGILHNIHSYSKVNPTFNIAQPKFKKTVEVKIEKPEAINVKCDVHGWMNGWVVATDNPYVAVTDSSGAFKLTDVPAGNYTVQVWHETLANQKPVTMKVTVKAKEDAKANFELKK
ncbi:MAG TPA: carboxypeptidase regulatory-like domain-containing protein [Candidatus Binatia bacterium]|jgi:plastocyanin